MEIIGVVVTVGVIVIRPPRGFRLRRNLSTQVPNSDFLSLGRPVRYVRNVDFLSLGRPVRLGSVISDWVRRRF